MSVLKYTPARGTSWLAAISHVVKGPAIKLGVDEPLRKLRAVVHPTYRREYIDSKNLRLLLAFTLAEDANCIDIGAHSGSVLTEIMHVSPRGKHIAYEPLPLFHTHLVEHFPTVDVRQVAVSNEEGERTFTFLKNIPGRSGFNERTFASSPQTERILVRTETLDSSLPKDYVPSLIKIDVEGAERLVLEGAINTISTYKPVIVFEHGMEGADHYDTQPRQIYELLHDKAGLRIFDMDGNGPYTLSQFEETYARNDRWNFVAC